MAKTNEKYRISDYLLVLVLMIYVQLFIFGLMGLAKLWTMWFGG